jgi:hypothetical protein
LVDARRNQHHSSEHVVRACHTGIKQGRPFEPPLDEGRY